MKIDWFSRGRDAFSQGKPCLITDARLTGKDRQQWYRGWRWQHNLNTPPASAEDRAAAIAALEETKQLIRKL